MGQSFGQDSLNIYQRYFGRALILSIIVSTGVLIYRFTYISIPKPNSNKFNTSLTSSEEIIDLYKPANFVGLSKEELLSLRAQAIKPYDRFLIGKYKPYALVFDQITDGLSWYSFSRFYKEGPGKNVGDSVESIAVLNPLILVVPEFWGISIWGESKLKWLKNLEVPSDLFSVKPSKLLVNGGNKTGTVSYSVSSYISELRPFIESPLTIQDIDFGVHAYNALDLGFEYIQFSDELSHSVTSPKGSKVVKISDILTYVGDMCGEPCNHRSDPHPDLDTFKVTSVPAKATFKLWKNYSENSEPDFLFVVEVL